MYPPVTQFETRALRLALRREDPLRVRGRDDLPRKARERLTAAVRRMARGGTARAG